jgi:hypothetical protein
MGEYKNKVTKLKLTKQTRIKNDNIIIKNKL